MKECNFKALLQKSTFLRYFAHHLFMESFDFSLADVIFDFKIRFQYVVHEIIFKSIPILLHLKMCVKRNSMITSITRFKFLTKILYLRFFLPFLAFRRARRAIFCPFAIAPIAPSKIAPSKTSKIAPLFATELSWV